MAKGTGVVGAVAMLLVLAGCSGDIAPFEEAIEVRDLGLVTLEIEPPLGSRVGPLFMNPGERIPFTLAGSGSGAGAIEVEARGRRWRVSDSRYASIDENGVLTARADGTFTVEVHIGDVTAQGFDVQVREAALESIVDIERAERETVPALLDPCIPAPYIALGLFNDGTTRRLSSVGWSVVEGSGMRRESRDDGSVLLTGTQPGEAMVRAESAGIGRPLSVTVEASLLSLEIGPTGNLRGTVGNTLALSATGTYGPQAGVIREVDVTQSVDWEVSEGTSFASVSTGEETRGVVSALRAGSAQVRASCGPDVDTQRQFVALGGTDSGSGGDDALSFEGAVGGNADGDGGSLSVSISAVRTTSGGIGSVQLVLLQGGDRVNTGVTWTLTDDGSGTNGSTVGTGLDGNFREPVGSLDSAGRFTPLSVGTAQVQATLGDRVSRLTIDVTL